MQNFIQKSGSCESFALFRFLNDFKIQRLTESAKRAQNFAPFYFVWTLVSFRQQGADDTELLRNYPSLTAQDLAAAWDYYKHHHLEIERAIADHNEDPLDD